LTGFWEEVGSIRPAFVLQHFIDKQT